MAEQQQQEQAAEAGESRFQVEPVIDREQLSVRSLAELLELQKKAEESKNQDSVRSLGELLSEPLTDSPAAARRRVASHGAQDMQRPRARSRSGTSGSLAPPERVIALGVDGSDQCRTAFHWYIDEMWKEGDQLLLVHVYEQPSLPVISLRAGLTIPSEVWQERLKESLQAAEKLVTQFESACLSYKINFQTVIRSGSAGEVFCDSAEQHKADFMVMGCRGHGKLRRTVLGSVSSYTINHAHVPVTVVPHPLKRRVKETREVET